MTPFQTVFGCDLRTLALFRIGLGIALWADLIDRGRDLRAHYTYWGVLPSPTNSEASIDSWVHLLIGSTTFEVGVFLASGLAGFALILGYQTRLVTMVCWVLQIFIQTSNFFVLNAGDILLLLLLFWSIFLPLGARYSCDAAVDLTPSEEFRNQFFSMGTIAILLQVGCMYFFSALHKTVSPAWIPDGTILYYVFNMKGFVLPFGEWLLGFPSLWQGLTYGAWVLELLGPFLLFSPWFFLPLRGGVLLLFVGLHLGIAICMNVGLFPLHNFVSLLLFIPACFWDEQTATLRNDEQTGLTIYYDGDCAFCRKMCLLARIFLLLPNIRIIPAQQQPSIFAIMERDNTWVVQDQDSLPQTRWDGVRLLVRHSPICWPLAKYLNVSFVHNVGTNVYRIIAKNRGFLSGLARFALPYHQRPLRPPIVIEVLVGFLAVYMVFINLTTLPKLPYWPFSISDPIAIVKRILHINQQWHMFSSPTTESRWIIIPGRLIDGTDVDVYNFRLQIPNLENPKFEESLFATNRWRKFFENMLDVKYEENHIDKHYARYLCRAWNEAHPPLQHLLYLHINVVVEDIPPPFSDAKPQKKIFQVREQSCLKSSM